MDGRYTVVGGMLEKSWDAEVKRGIHVYPCVTINRALLNAAVLNLFGLVSPLSTRVQHYDVCPTSKISNNLRCVLLLEYISHLKRILYAEK